MLSLWIAVSTGLGFTVIVVGEDAEEVPAALVAVAEYVPAAVGVKVAPVATWVLPLNHVYEVAPVEEAVSCGNGCPVHTDILPLAEIAGAAGVLTALVTVKEPVFHASPVELLLRLTALPAMVKMAVVGVVLLGVQINAHEALSGVPVKVFGVV